MKINLPQDVEIIFNLLNTSGYKSYAVGGCVRDSLLNKTPKDWDITTNALPDEVVNIFQSNGHKVIPTGLKHGTVTIVLNSEHYEVTTYRIDQDYTDGRHPDKVEFTNNLVEDLKRRDFTINAMAYNNIDGLIDPFHGLNYLADEIISCVGNPNERFQEDGLRILRAIRFASQLNFEIDLDTSEAIYQNRKLLKNISKERIREELNKILLSNKPSKGFKSLAGLGLLDYTIPELKDCIGFNQHNPNHDKHVFNHIMSVLDNTESDLVLRLAALFHDIGKPPTFSIGNDGIGHFYSHHLRSSDIAEEIMKRLKYDNKTIEQVSILVREHMSRYEKLRVKNTKKFINRVGIENLDRLFKLQIADIQGSTKRDDINNIIELKKEVERVLNEKQPLTLKDLEVNGYDLIQIGIPKGKQIGEILNELLEIVLEQPEFNQKQKLIEFMKSRMA